MASLFEVQVQSSSHRFTLPKEVRERLGIADGDSVFLTIRSPGKEVIFKGRKTLRSGPEIYGMDVSSALIPGTTILVEASRPRFAQSTNPGRISKRREIARRAARSVDDKTRKRRFWIVSPNVMNNDDTVPEWRNASVVFNAAFMGWGPNKEDHKRIGFTFARVIEPGDIVLIARRHRGEPEVVGFGVVKGRFRTSLQGFTAPKKERWQGSLRKLSPFIPWTELPPSLDIMRVLNHTTALRQLVPERNENERAVCEWLESTIGLGPDSGKRAYSALRRSTGTKLRSRPIDRELEYQVRTREQTRLAIKREAELVKGYSEWLGAQSRVIRTAWYGSLQCDAFEERRNNLIEAKCSSKREYIRMAVGQLLDYSHLGQEEFGDPNLAILLPKKPLPDIESWLKKKLRISIIWRDGKDFLDNANGRFT